MTRPPACSLAPKTPGGISGGCTSGKPAMFRVRLTFLRADLSGVDTKEFDLCGPCYPDKLREADAEGSTLRIIAAYRR